MKVLGTVLSMGAGVKGDMRRCAGGAGWLSCLWEPCRQASESTQSWEEAGANLRSSLGTTVGRW